MKRLILFCIVSSLSRFSQAELSSAGIANNCRNCHNSAATEPVLSSLPSLTAAQLSSKLLDFKYDRIPATLMPRIAKGYSDAQLNAVAEYLGRH
ncbi:hypothetical protein KEF85_14900 [Methylomonas paludis]|uniref:Cytochrome c domain-containing protein n=1 Tax=Methylomonas paludis TaxID=1173101 RepID=A0A975R9V9_9GAMM|nr:hypothetical protein [Methylomonas paludis]QWF70596.1 hypothetical protein KEF85_14900 [Methylomonas paludis]